MAPLQSAASVSRPWRRRSEAPNPGSGGPRRPSAWVAETGPRLASLPHRAWPPSRPAFRAGPRAPAGSGECTRRPPSTSVSAAPAARRHLRRRRRCRPRPRACSPRPTAPVPPPASARSPRVRRDPARLSAASRLGRGGTKVSSTPRRPSPPSPPPPPPPPQPPRARRPPLSRRGGGGGRGAPRRPRRARRRGDARRATIEGRRDRGSRDSRAGPWTRVYRRRRLDGRGGRREGGREREGPDRAGARGGGAGARVGTGARRAGARRA